MKTFLVLTSLILSFGANAGQKEKEIRDNANKTLSSREDANRHQKYTRPGKSPGPSASAKEVAMKANKVLSRQATPINQAYRKQFDTFKDPCTTYRCSQERKAVAKQAKKVLSRQATPINQAYRKKFEKK